MCPQTSSIVIADDHTVIAEACKNLLEPEFKVTRCRSRWVRIMIASLKRRRNSCRECMVRRPFARVNQLERNVVCANVFGL